MSDLANHTQLRILVKRSIASLIFVFACGLLLAPQAAFADDTLPPVTEVPAPETPTPPTTLPSVCSALLAPIAPEEPTNPDLSDLGWTSIALTGVANTANSALSWQWVAPTNANAQATYRGYGYALYQGESLLAIGELSPEITQYNYSASVNGSYRLFVWILDDTTDPIAPVATGCQYSDTVFDTAGPVISGDSWLVNGNTATPLLSSDEPGVTLSWGVNAGDGAVTISDPFALNPTFRFLADGTYTFTLTATDSLGNTTIVTLVISYFAPFIPGPEVPLPPEAPAPVDPYVPPAVALAQVQRQTAVGSSYSASIGGEVAIEDTTSDIAASNSAATGSAGANDAQVTKTAQAVQPSSQGWVILGVPWYWWLLGVAIIGTAWQWYRSGAFRKTPDDL